MVKNARGHVYYELGQPAFGEPTTVNIVPLIALSEKQRDDFLTVSHGVAWPEVGSRMMTRLATGQDLRNGWIVVQEGSYRFFAVEDDGYLVRMVIHDYLGAEVYWRY